MSNPILTREEIKQADALEEILAESIPSNRRDFLKRGTLAATALTMAGAWMAQPQPLRAADDTRTDLELLTESFTLEQKAANTYVMAGTQASATGTPLIQAEMLSIVTQFRKDHLAHADRFREVIQQLGGTVPADTVATTTVDLPVGPNSPLNTSVGIIRYVLGVEVFAMKQWVNYFQISDSTQARRVFLDLAPSEGAHAAILRGALKLILAAPTDYDNVNQGKAIVPHAFVSADMPVF